MIVGQAAVTSAARPEQVWERLVDGRRWSAWNGAAAWMVCEGPCAPGGYVTIKPKRGRQTAYHIDAADPPHRFAIRLTFGPLAELRLAWSVAAAPEGSRIEHEVAVDGPLAGLLVGGMARRALAAAPQDLARLARLAEAKKSAADERPRGTDE